MFYKHPKWLINEYIRQINKELFNGCLPLEEIKITQKLKDKSFAALACGSDIELNPFYVNNADLLFETLAHELIHVYQDLLGLPPNHNTKFFRFFEEKANNLYDCKLGLAIY